MSDADRIKTKWDRNGNGEAMPWTATVDGKRLESKRGTGRWFRTEEAARRAAQDVIRSQETERADGNYESYERVKDALCAERAAHERTKAAATSPLKALARIAAGNETAHGEMMSAEQMMRIARAVLLDMRGDKTVADADVERARAIIAERDTAVAEASAMRAAFLLVVPSGAATKRDEWEDGDGNPIGHVIAAAFSGTAGLALAERVRLLETLLRQSKQVFDQPHAHDKGVACSECAMSASIGDALDAKGTTDA